MKFKGLLFTVMLVVGTSSAASAAEAGRAAAATGRLRLTFAERSPLSTLDGVCRAAKLDPRKEFTPENREKWNYDLAQESFEAFIPRGYNPKVPYGLFVFISPGEAHVPRGWIDALGRHKLIWVSANNTGNSRGIPIRMGLALDAAHNMVKRYNLDQSRIYIGGIPVAGRWPRT
jgi:hypothetical protein